MSATKHILVSLYNDMKQLPGISLEYSCGVQRVTDVSGGLNEVKPCQCPSVSYRGFYFGKSVKKYFGK
jgi:hypothetical protein